MSEQAELPTTQRAYTLRLRGVDPNDNAWRDALWATHEAVNKGAKVFGDWLLTLRGGLSHELADNGPMEQRPQRRVLLALSWLSVEDERGAPTNPDLIVAFGDRCTHHRDSQSARDEKVVKAFRRILSKRLKNKDDVESWAHDCEGSMKVRIRDDAVWVNRSAYFEIENQRLGGALTEVAVWDLLKPLFGSPEKMLAPATLGEEEDQTEKQNSNDAKADAQEETDGDTTEKEASNVTETGRTVAKDFVKKAGKWLNLRYKAGGGADYEGVAKRFEEIANIIDGVAHPIHGDALIEKIARALEHNGKGRDGIVSAVGYTGSKRKGAFFTQLNGIQPDKTYQSRDLQALLGAARERAAELKDASTGRKNDPKGPRPWSKSILQDVAEACGFDYASPDKPKSSEGGEAEGANHGEYSVMLDHAMRRVSMAHSWIKRAEATRAKFETDRARIDQVPVLIHDWLDDFFGKRGSDANAVDGYSVRRRALGGKHAKAWKAVVEVWARRDTEEERREAVTQVQSDWDDEEKFGHADLFIALADDDVVHLWKDGPQALIDYVAARDAEARAKRYKVPAYRHPDAHCHPVFTDFGCSRWRVEYEAHKVRHGFAKAQNAVEEKLAQHASGNTAEAALKSAKTRLAKTRAEVERTGASAKISMRLWNKPPPADHSPMRKGEFHWSDELSGGLRWHSSRLRKDLGLDSASNNHDVQSESVTRADRLGRAAANADSLNAVSLSNVFTEDYWNARLQAPRRELEARAKRQAEGRGPGLIRWFLTFSPRLETRGPFIEWTLACNLQLDQKPDGDRQLILPAPDPKRRKRNEWRGLAYPFWHPDHKKGTIGHAKLLLSRLPGLRVLSVDLGHRFAAACVVWEALDAKTFDIRRKIDAARQGGARIEGSVDDLYVHIICKKVKEQRGKAKEIEETTVYRRIGADKLDGSPHPAPWARLDRQFFIKLQGEERPARKASTQEYEYVRHLESEELGRVRTEKNLLPWRVDELMSAAVGSIRLALRRHGDAARIAYALKPDSLRLAPGGGAQEHTPVTRKAAVLDALVRWHEIAVSAKWKDDDALNRWNYGVRPLVRDSKPSQPPQPEGDDANDPDRIRKREKKAKRWEEIWEALRCGLSRRTEEEEEIPNRLERKADGEAIRALLEPIAEALRDDTKMSSKLAEQWKVRWDADNRCWPARLKSLRHWLLPRGIRPGKSETQEQTEARVKRRRAALHVGGLSLTRIATIRTLWQVQKAYRYKATPDDLRSGAKLIEEDSAKGYKFGDRALQAMEHMREQRVKQIASRIVEAALGVGLERKRVWDNVKKKWRYPKRPQQLLSTVKENQREDGTSRFDPCHAVVVENLRNYRPDELQTRRENRALLSWSSGKVRKYLEEACQLHGLHLREVSANYTSRQCSRTGSPGLRCDEVSVTDFLDMPWWRKAVRRAKERKEHPTKERPYDAEARMFVALDEKWPDRSAHPEAKRNEYAEKVKRAKSLRLITKGGDLFVAGPKNSDRLIQCAVQADLTAAANIGLRALVDPDFAGKWWYISCIEDKATGTAIPRADKVKGSECFKPDPTKPEQFGSLVTPPSAAEPAKSAKRKSRRKAISEASDAKEMTNFWSDPSTNDLRNAADGGFWLPTPAYWRWVRNRVVAILWKHNGLAPAEPDLATEGETR